MPACSLNLLEIRDEVGNITFFGWTMVSTITRRVSWGAITPVRMATERLSCSSAATRSSPILWRHLVNDERTAFAFPGTLTRQGGYLLLPEATGLGVKLDAARLPEVGKNRINPTGLPLRNDGSVAYVV